MREIPLMKEFEHEAAMRLPWVRLFRRNVGTIKLENRVFKSGIKGQCDLFGLVKGGWHVEIETKAYKGVLNDNQKRWRDWCIEWRVPWLCLKAKKDEPALMTVDRWVVELRELTVQT